jgi:hypothetical protein
MAVDDVAAQFPAGQIVPLRFYSITMLASRHRDAVFLVPPADRDLYEELTGRSGRVSFQPKTEGRPPRPPSGEAECRNVQPAGRIRSTGESGASIRRHRSGVKAASNSIRSSSTAIAAPLRTPHEAAPAVPRTAAPITPSTSKRLYSAYRKPGMVRNHGAW